MINTDIYIGGVISSLHFSLDVDECTTGNGGCDDECVNLDGSYICRCTQPGYYLQADEHDCKCKSLHTTKLFVIQHNNGLLTIHI